MLAGGLSGFLYQFYSYPFDTIKTNIQSREKTFLELMKTKFWLHKSYRKGLKITCCKDMIITPIYLTVYEHMRHCMLKSRKFWYFRRLVFLYKRKRFFQLKIKSAWSFIKSLLTVPVYHIIWKINNIKLKFKRYLCINFLLIFKIYF